MAECSLDREAVEMLTVYSVALVEKIYKLNPPSRK